MRFDLDVNGRARSLDTAPDRPLLDVLREDLGLTGTKYGCGEGACRACTVLLDGRPVTSCRVPVERAAGREVLTIEGLADGDSLHPVQQAFVDAGAMQCGYCIPGMVLAAVALLAGNEHPSREEAVAALDGNLCRCCGYLRILDAVELAARAGAEPVVSPEVRS